jgi:NAD(P)H-hydrate repair Nnr-like enzyme with NAD(P)H-hydrate epimerase domain
MIEVDRLMTECYGISLIQMMENAGRNLAVLVKHILDSHVGDRKICVVIGNGNNGGGGTGSRATPEQLGSRSNRFGGYTFRII